MFAWPSVAAFREMVYQTRLTRYGLVLAATSMWLAYRIYRTRQRLKTLSNLSGLRVLLDPTFPYPFVPTIPGVCMEAEWFSTLKHEPFAQAGADIITAASILPSPSASYIVCDPVAIKEILRARLFFPKAVDLMEQFNIFGVNIVTAEGHEYRRHRTPVHRSFSERNNQMVWDTSVKVLRSMFELDTWKNGRVDHTEDAAALTTSITLQIISATAFGRQSSAERESNASPSSPSFEDALMTASASLIQYAIIPRPLLRLAKAGRAVDDAFSQVSRTVSQIIEERKMEDLDAQADLLSALIQAADEEKDPKMRLTEADLLVDATVFLVAGHETTAHNIAFVLGLLALYQDEQRLIYEEVMAVTSDSGDLTYEHFDRLERCLAFIYEALRLYPPFPLVMKRCTTDTTVHLAVPTQSGLASVPVPEGTLVTLHIQALHHNPRYWPEPHAFRPSRFLAHDWPRDAFLPFSGGSRACIGRRYAETELVALVATMVRDYVIELRDDVDVKGGEDERTRRERVIRPRQGLTLGPHGLQIKFRRRTSGSLRASVA